MSENAERKKKMRRKMVQADETLKLISVNMAECL